MGEDATSHGNGLQQAEVVVDFSPTPPRSGETKNIWAPTLNFTKGVTCVSQALGPLEPCPPPAMRGCHLEGALDQDSPGSVRGYVPPQMK
ncbi:hypothetical protein TNCV_2887761 [Trichonephila clavipes]|nr:hypothetical protein TNCV_2887761 [Trichonephila clavipes]